MQLVATGIEAVRFTTTYEYPKQTAVILSFVKVRYAQSQIKPNGSLGCDGARLPTYPLQESIETQFCVFADDQANGQTNKQNK